MKHIFAIFAALAAVGQPAVQAAPVYKSEDPLAGKPPFRRLFLNSMVTEESQGLTRAFHQAAKYGANPLIPRDKPWEGWGPVIGGTVLRDGSKFRAYYYCTTDKGTYTCVAESEDGLKWVKPVVGTVEFDGSKENNIIAPVNSCGNAAVFKAVDPPSPERKWIMYSNGQGVGPHLGYSSDGIHWSWDPDVVKLFSTSDVTNFFYDPYKSRFVCTFKTSNRKHRAVGVVFSEDGITWRKPIDGAVFGSDDLDPDATQIYGMPVFPYQGMYIGVPWMFHARFFKYGRYNPDKMLEAQFGGGSSKGDVDAQLAWSWNLISWNRTPERKPFLALGPDGAWDDSQIYTAREPLVVGDELWFYYCGMDALHDGSVPKCAIGLAKLRLDGFCSMQAGDKEGWLISRREVFNTPRVTINAKCAPGGYVAAELVDRNNNVIQGFSREDCLKFTGDSVRGELTWKTKEFPRDMLDKDKKVRFFIKNAGLYSYLPVDINQTIDDGWPD